MCWWLIKKNNLLRDSTLQWSGLTFGTWVAGEPLDATMAKYQQQFIKE